MVWAIIKIYTSKYAQMDPQRLAKTPKFYFRIKKCDIEKILGGTTTPLEARRLNKNDIMNKFHLGQPVIPFHLRILVA